MANCSESTHTRDVQTDIEIVRSYVRCKMYMNKNCKALDRQVQCSGLKVQHLSEPAQKAPVFWSTVVTPKDFKQPNVIIQYKKENTHTKYSRPSSNHISYHITSCHLQIYRNVNTYVYSKIYCILPTSLNLHSINYCHNSKAELKSHREKMMT